MSDNQTTWPAGYDGLSLAIIAVCTSTAGAMLFTRIVQRISAVQELCAERQGLVPPRHRKQGDSINAGVVDLLKSTALVVCLGLALLAAGWPSIASNVLAQLRAAAFGQVARLEEQGRRSRAEILQASAKDVNRTVPQQIDQITRLDRVRVEGDQFVYEYTLNVDKLAGDDLSNLFRHVRSNAVPAFCTGQMKGFRQLNAVLVYRYSYANGGHIGQVAITERDCH